MKMRLLTALVAIGCFSQMAVASDLKTGSITGQTIATATLTLGQSITLENTLNPKQGLKPGSRGGAIPIATGNLKIKEAGITARIAVKMQELGFNSFVTYAAGHNGDSAYKLEYNVQPTSQDFDTFTSADGMYILSSKNVDSWDYEVKAAGNSSIVLPKAGNYQISVTVALYNP